MTTPTKYLLVSLPTSITPSNDRDEAFDALRGVVSSTISSSDQASVYSWPIPELKIGTLDALVQQADDLAKLDTACEGVASKIGDALRNILEGDQEKLAQQKAVNDSEFWREMDIHTGKSRICVRVNQLLIYIYLYIRRTGRSIFTNVLLEQSQISRR